MLNFIPSEILPESQNSLFEKARNMEKISDSKELDKPITNFVDVLGKDTVFSEEDIDMDDVLDEEDDYLISLTEDYEKLVSGCPIDGHNGSWDELRGNSMWRPDREAVPTRFNPEKYTWGKILDKYGIEGIEYQEGDPSFSCISKGVVEIEDFSSDRPSNFAQADEALAKQKGCSPGEVKRWREDNGYTWHECRDCKTMQKVPREIHNNMDHSGGISEFKRIHKS